MQTHWIEARHITKRFGPRVILSNCSLHIDRGATLAITGKSGSGKSTLLHILSLLEPASEGQLYWGKQLISHPRTRPARQLRREQIGYLFQNYALLDDRSVEENLAIAVGLRTDLHTAAQRRDRVEEALAAVGLEGMGEHSIRSLSGGEQQRVAFARLLLKPCSVIFADEPTGNLDVEQAERIWTLLFDMARQGKAVVVVTHQKDILSRFDRVFSLDEKGEK